MNLLKVIDVSKNLNINIDSTFAFEQWLVSDNYFFKVILNDNYSPESHNNKNYFFVFNEIDKLTTQFQSFEIEPIKEESSILKITLKSQ